ncbi:HEAT repeat domain-containing protein [Sinorhizobium meliloti]|uniref:HEAT repeat domain-containing protein n=1 Tax=Rhizobium meliloti TaxID=382 RepID=UPI000FDBCEB2|nr:hypothetical protein [Sinorhizobium meliloti]RVG74056.1 hypothetical protein CN220_06980 [Sinorhizobium meliloti]
MPREKNNKARFKASKSGRRRNAKSEAPATSLRVPGNPSYAAYDYQVDVTVWIGLELMLAKGITSEIIVEPPSDEDMEAAVTKPDLASLGFKTALSEIRLSVQAKSRTTAPWSSLDFSNILLGKPLRSEQDGPSKGPALRERPLDMLSADPTAHYLFVTNEAIDASLRPHTNFELLDFPETDLLPPFCREGKSAVEQAELARRIGICAAITTEVLETRILKLLDNHGNVPPQRLPDCLTWMRAEIRERVKGNFGGRWTLADVLATITNHGGSQLAHRRHDQFVPPRSFTTIERTLRDRHAVIIVGPSGTGKSLTADVINAKSKRQSPAFLGREVRNAGEARIALTDPGPILMYLVDPWGDAVPSVEAARWTSELPILFRLADDAHKFLVTSRFDIFTRSQPDDALQSYAVHIEPTDYTDDQRGKIYDNHVSDLTGYARSLALTHRQAALQSLQRPYEIERFLEALTRESESNPRRVAEILADAGIEAISSVIRRQVLGWGADGLACAALLWGLISPVGRLDLRNLRSLTRELRRRRGSAPHIEGFIDFLAAGRNLRKEGDTVRLQHPRVEEGLRLALGTNRIEAEAQLTDLAEALLMLGSDNDWNLQAGLELMRAASRLEGIEIIIDAAAQAKLDQALCAWACSPRKLNSLERTFRDLERFARADFPPRRFVEALYRAPPEQSNAWFPEPWKAPALSPTDLEHFRNDPTFAALLRNFVRGVLPFVDVDYGAAFSTFASSICDNLEPAFADAVLTLADLQGPGNNIENIVDGALSPNGVDFDWVIDAFVQGEKAANRWMEEFRQEQLRAEEHEVDAIQADHILEEPSERYYTVSKGLEVVALARLKAEGMNWLEAHPHAPSLVDALISAVKPEQLDTAYLRMLLNHADGYAQAKVWPLIASNWDAVFYPDLAAALQREDMASSDLRDTLAALAIDASKPDKFAVLDEVLPLMRPFRRMEFVLDLQRAFTELGKSTADYAEKVVERLEPTEKELAHILLSVNNEDDIGKLLENHSTEVELLIVSLLAESRHELTGLLVCLAAPGNRDIVPAARRLLATGEVDDGMPAFIALRIRGGHSARQLIEECLDHKRYRVRRAAMEHLVSNAEIGSRAGLLKMAKDRSADVRLRWVELMEEHRWPEAEASVAALIRDDRDFGLDRAHNPGSGWARYSVARAAARALAAYPTLSASSIEALISASQSFDPFVYAWALSTISTKDDPRTLAALRDGLLQAGVGGDLKFRPAAQAAAWGYFDRAVEGMKIGSEDIALLRRLALTEPAWIAGPAVMAVAICDGSALSSLADELIGRGMTERAELLKVTAAINGEPFSSYPQAEAIADRLRGQKSGDEELDDPDLISWAASRGVTLLTLPRGSLPPACMSKCRISWTIPGHSRFLQSSRS